MNNGAGDWEAHFEIPGRKAPNNVWFESDKLSDKYINILIDICNIESKSDNKEGVDKVGDYLASVAKDLDYEITKKEFENSGNVYSFTYKSV